MPIINIRFKGQKTHRRIRAFNLPLNPTQNDTISINLRNKWTKVRILSVEIRPRSEIYEVEYA